MVGLHGPPSLTILWVFKKSGILAVLFQGTATEGLYLWLVFPWVLIRSVTLQQGQGSRLARPPSTSGPSWNQLCSGWGLEEDGGSCQSQGSTLPRPGAFSVMSTWLLSPRPVASFPWLQQAGELGM